MKKIKIPACALIVLSLIFFLSDNSYAQSNAVFGQNKVQYETFKWSYLQSKHFDIYFSEGGYKLAEFTAHTIEEALRNMSENIDYNISNRIPVIVYNSHIDFQQNNVVDEFLSEGIGGVTELFKNRINIPFEGDYEKFRHVIHHELLHAFMNDMYYGGSIQNIISKNISLAFPLWFSEGMAEVQSRYGLDKQTDMFMRDATIHNYVPPLEYMGGYFAYRGGQSFFSFLADTYGEDKLGILMNNIKAYGDVDRGFMKTYQMSMAKLDEKWQSYLKKTYWTELKTREDVKDFAKQLTSHEEDGGSYNISPVISPNGDKFAFISNQDDLFDVFIASTKNGKILKKIIEGNNSTDFEELHILTPGLAWSPDGRKIAISVKSGGSDVIYIVDIITEDMQEFNLHFDGINYIGWSPAGDKFAFIGTRKEKPDLYIYHIKTKKLENLTDDVFTDANPTWAADGKSIFFTSDRGSFTVPSMIPEDFKMWEYDYSRNDYYRIDVATKEITRLSHSKNAKESYVQINSDGSKLLYISDKNGISNIYLREKDSTGKIIDRPITNSLNPIDQLSLSRDGKKVLFVSLNKGGYDIFSIDNPFDINLGMEELELTDYAKKMKDYDNKFGRRKDFKFVDSADYAVNEETGDVDSLFVAVDSLKTGMDSLSLTEAIDSLNNEQETDIVNIEKQDTVSELVKNEIKETNDSVKTYGDDVSISFETPRNMSSSMKDSAYFGNSNFKVANNFNDDGSYKIKDYKIKFSPDLVYGNADYTTFYGLRGVAQVALSDILGNHRIYIQTSLIIDIKNSDYAVAYYYLPQRIDYGFQLYHTARFLTYGTTVNNFLYRYRTLGGFVSASLPISRFKRIEGSVGIQHITRENLDISIEPVETKTFLNPYFSLVHDNTIFGYTAPVSGTRYNLTFSGSPKFGENGIGFASSLLDFRHYMKISDDYTFVARLSGGASFGPNPQRFFIGGTDNWIDPTYENNYLPISDIEDFAFSAPGLPLRGFNYDRMSGSKYSILNLEMRFPLFKYLIFGALPLGFANIEGVAFLDAGTAWTNNDALKLVHKVNGHTETNDLLMGTGFGTRANLLGFPFKFDIAWNYNLNKFSSPKYYISLGYNF
ncbi:MAG: PD40 domain-containing protein [Ignavibacteria bacterium]|nr:PD40 domain-containing protein [Ignavibacteria bacterium]